jgi:hypothetical protein
MTIFRMGEDSKVTINGVEVTGVIDFDLDDPDADWDRLVRIIRAFADAEGVTVDELIARVGRGVLGE